MKLGHLALIAVALLGAAAAPARAGVLTVTTAQNVSTGGPISGAEGSITLTSGDGTTLNPYLYEFTSFTDGLALNAPAKIYTNPAAANSGSFKLDLKGGAISGGGDLTTYLSTSVGGDGAVSGSITIVGATGITLGLLSTEPQTKKSAAAISVTQTGAFEATRINTHADNDGTPGAQSFTGNDTGLFRLTGTGTSMDSRYTGVLGNNGGAISIQDYASVSVAGAIISTSGSARGGTVDIGASGNVIGGTISVGDLNTAGGVIGRDQPPNVKLYAGGAITTGSITTGLGDVNSYGGNGYGPGDITVVGTGAFTAGVVKAEGHRDGHAPVLSFDGGNHSGAFTATSISTATSSIDGRAAGSTTIKNYSAVTVNGDLKANVVTASTNAPGGSVTINSGITGDIEIGETTPGNWAGLINLSAFGTGAKGTLSLKTDGSITLANLDLSTVANAQFDAPGNTTIKGLLAGFTDGNTHLQVPSGQKIFYDGALNPTLLAGGVSGVYNLKAWGGTLAGGTLEPLAVPEPATMALLALGGLATAARGLRRRRAGQ